MNDGKSTGQSPYRRGADAGLILGMYLCVIFFATAYSMTYSILSLVSLVLIAGVPVFIYISLRRSYLADMGKTIFSSLWMEGIATFFFGGVLAAFVSVIYMRYINPGFIDAQIDTMISVYNQTDWERGKELADIVSRAREARLIPRPIEFAINMLWLIVFSGSILSMLMSLLVQARGYNKKHK